MNGYSLGRSDSVYPIRRKKKGGHKAAFLIVFDMPHPQEKFC